MSSSPGRSGRRASCSKRATAARFQREEDENREATADTLRWNRSLSTRFDVAEEKISPAALAYDWVAKHIGCDVKEIFQNSFSIPSYRIGGVLSGLKQAMLGNDPVAGPPYPLRHRREALAPGRRETGIAEPAGV